MLTKNQLMELREAFNLLDTDSDMKLTAEDLTSFLQNIGSPYSQAEIKEMIEEIEINPTYLGLLTVLGEKLEEIDSEREIYEALSCFDDKGDGFIEPSLFKKWMTENGDAISVSDYEYLVRGCMEDGQLNYKKLSLKMKHGEIIEEN